MRHISTVVTALACAFVACGAWAASSGVGVVLMHGKGGSPAGYVSALASRLKSEGFEVANIEMPWSKNRDYDVDMQASDREIAASVAGLQAKGAQRIFVAGHSQGGLNALLFAGKHRVDGVIAIAPGGSVGAMPFRNALGAYVKKAKAMIDEGKGGETSEFADFEGRKGTTPVTTTAAIYYDWFNPDGEENMDYAARHVLGGTPVLYIAPKHDYPGLQERKDANFHALPSTPLTRMYEPDSDHLHAPEKSADEIIKWIHEVAGG